MKHRIILSLLFLLFFVTDTKAQHLNFHFKDVSLSDALLAIDDACDTVTVNFIYDELEDFRVTTEVADSSVLGAVRQVCGFYPMRITAFANDIFVECTQRDSVRFIARVTDHRGNPLRFCNVSLARPGSLEVVNTGVSNDDGYVIIPTPISEVVVKVTHVGYNTLEQTCRVGETDHLVLSPSTERLERVTIEGEAPEAEYRHRSYRSLWKEAWRKAVADLPRSQLKVLGHIMAKARTEDNAGQLLAAELTRASVLKSLSPDSVPVAINGMKEQLASVQTHNPELAAVYQAVLSRLLAAVPDLQEEAEVLGHKAVSQPDLLAGREAKWLLPLLEKGNDSSIFGHDLLSVVGMTVGQYQALHDFYAARGNREAQMVMAYLMLDDHYRDNKGRVLTKERDRYMAQLDSLITLYGDLPVCCELAIARYQVMKSVSDITVEQRYAYLQQAIERWGSWRNAPSLSAALESLSQPMMTVDLGSQPFLPHRPLTVRFKRMRNVESVRIRVSRMELSQEDVWDLPYRIGDDWIEKNKKKVGRQVLSVSHGFPENKVTQVFNDSVALQGLPPGAYLMEVTPGTKSLDAVREVFFVSGVRVIYHKSSRPMRCVVVDALSGHPLPRAKMVITDDDGDDRVFTADAKGEISVPRSVYRKAVSMMAFTDADHFLPDCHIWGYNYPSQTLSTSRSVQLFTDRGIYRPGQVVQVALIASSNERNSRFKMLADTKIKVAVRDANHTLLLDTALVTDEFGTASFAYTLPEGHRNGNFSVNASFGNRRSGAEGVCRFRVEEYKLPTFEVNYLPFNADSIAADTLFVPLQAKAFSGAQVSHARVAASVVCRDMGLDFADTLFTDVQGRCVLKVPVALPEVDDVSAEKDQYTLSLRAAVTDRAGETHEQSSAITVSRRKHTLAVTLREQNNPVDSMAFATLKLSDRLMKPMDGVVAYYIDRPDTLYHTKANVPFALPRCEALSQAGEHRLYAVFEGDTVSTKFFVINYQASRPDVFTPVSFAVSAPRFPAEGGEVFMQLGSSLRDVYVVYEIMADNKVIESGNFALDNSMYNRSFRYRPEYGAGLSLSFAFVKEGVVYAKSAEIAMPLPDKSLRMEWSSFRDRLVPGQKEEWRLKVSHPDGSPAKAQLLSTMFDASLAKITPFSWQYDVLRGYYVAHIPWQGATSDHYRPVSVLGDLKWKTVSAPLSFSILNERLLSLSADENTCYGLMRNSPRYMPRNDRKGRHGYVSGVVVDEMGEPVIGASVMVSGSRNGTVTNFDGEFQLASNVKTELSVSYIGMLTERVKAQPGRFYEIVLRDDNNALNEVVVVGYGTNKKHSLTGSVQKLEGMAPGLQVSTEVHVRGAAAPTSAMPPLYVVDGVPVEDISQIDMSHVASISVLKDASAVGIYGARAAGGVVVISTQGPPMADAAAALNSALGHPQVPMRENFQETAFFFPRLVTDGQGEVALQFTLPESVTTWQLYCLAHDRESNCALMQEQVVAQKQVMALPNLPRFVREGDEAQIVVRVANLCEEIRSGIASVQLLDASSLEVIAEESRSFSVSGSSTEPVAFNFRPVEGHPLLVCCCSVRGEGFSDGEQRYLPVLSPREWVTDTRVLTMHEPGSRQIRIDSLFPAGSTMPRLTVEYTDQPAWLMVGALPTLTAQPDEDAISQAAAYYVNMLVAQMAKSNPALAQMVEKWRTKDDTGSVLQSALEKDAEVKTLLLQETPWMMEAADETAQMHSLAKLFDVPTMKMRTEGAWRRLKALQRTDGGWPWCKGMDSSPYVTTSVLTMLARLHYMGCADGEMQLAMSRGLKFLDKVMATEVEWLQKREKEMKENDLQPRGSRSNTLLTPSETALHYLYIRALFGAAPIGKDRENYDYLLSYLKKRNLSLTIYGKAAAAVIMARNDETSLAREYLQSAREYAVQTDEAGLYYDTPKAYYSWTDYRIPTQVMVMEAIRLVEPADTLSLELMKRWLLHEKRTQAWDTPVNSVEAIHAFLGEDVGKKALSVTNAAKPVFRIDNEMLPMPEAAIGTGYVKRVIDHPQGIRLLSVEKASQGTSWGAVYAQAEKPLSAISDAGTGFSIQRELLHDGKVVTENTPLHVGDKVSVRIRIKAERDYDFVQVVDKRAACLEPAVQTSGYTRGCFCSKRDCSTVYFFDRMSKGEHVVETEYYVDRVGSYQWGTCTTQCAYAPEFTARTVDHQPLTVQP